MSQFVFLYSLNLTAPAVWPLSWYLSIAISPTMRWLPNRNSPVRRVAVSFECAPAVPMLLIAATELAEPPNRSLCNSY